MFRSFSLRSLMLTLGFVTALLLQAQAQKNEVGLVIGATTSPSLSLGSGNSPASNGSQNIGFGTSLALGAEYDRLLTSGSTAVYVGVDYVASPLDVKLNRPAAAISPQYAYEFLTPHVRVKFRTDAALQPWLVFGGGYTRFNASAPPTSTGFHSTSNTGGLEFGAGVDTAPLIHLLKLPIAARIEVRDFYSGAPNYSQTLTSGRQNTVIYTGGLVLRF